MVKVRTPGTWLIVPDAYRPWGVSIKDIAFEGSTGAVWMGNEKAGGSYSSLSESVLHNLGFTNFAGVLGTPGVPLLLTTSRTTGSWNVNNPQAGKTSICVGGTDSHLWVVGNLLIDGNAAAGQPHVIFNYLDISYVANIYMTAERNAGGLRINSGQRRSLWLSNLILGGRNVNAPHTETPVLTIDGDAVTTIRDSWISITTMPTNRGIIEATRGAKVTLADCHYLPANGVPVDQLWLRADGAGTRVKVRDAQPASDAYPVNVRADNGARVTVV